MAMVRPLLLSCLPLGGAGLVLHPLGVGPRPRSPPPSLLATEPASPPLTLMVNGLPGAMGVEIAAACLRRGIALAPFAMTGDQIEQDEVIVDDGKGGAEHRVRLFKANKRAELADLLAKEYATPGSLVCIDFTHPSAVNANAEWYVENSLPFVMGTTGGDREALMKSVGDANLYCVIAPNMAKQIVALQATLEHMASEFPGSFDGYSLRVVESHQSTKADTSGTAKAISSHLAKVLSNMST